MTTLETRIQIQLNIMKDQIKNAEFLMGKEENKLLYSQISDMRKSLDSLDNYLIAKRHFDESRTLP